MPWDWYGISRNPNITWGIIRDNLEKPWNWKSIFSNTFQKEKELFFEDSYKEHLTAYKIQNWWFKITMSPYYKIGRKFIARDGIELFKEYNELTKSKISSKP